MRNVWCPSKEKDYGVCTKEQPMNAELEAQSDKMQAIV